jgi:hypothetical protein
VSAEEFAEWSEMFSAEELHPNAERVRHAQLLAALANGELRHPSKKMFAAQDFMRDPWKKPEPKVRLTAAQVAAQVSSINASRRNRGGRR